MPPWMFVICFQIPGYALALYFEERENANLSPSMQNLWKQFKESGNDDFRNDRFKILPNVPDGANWLVRRAVRASLGSSQGIWTSSGTRTTISLEATLDIANSYMASKILSVVKGYAKSLVIDLAFMLEARDIEELPERVLCAFRLHHVHLDEINHMDVTEHSAKDEPDGSGMDEG